MITPTPQPALPTVLTEEDLIELGRIYFEDDGLRFTGEPPIGAFAETGAILARAYRCLAWWIGDWFNMGESLHGEAFSQLLDATQFDPATVQQYAWVARQVPRERRRASLSFSHHREVADLAPAEQTRWLARAEADGFSSHRLRRELAKALRAEARIWVLVEARSPADAEALVDRFEREGRAARIVER